MKEFFEILFTEAGISIEIRFEQSANAKSPILARLSGKRTDLIFVLLAKALSSITVVGYLVKSKSISTSGLFSFR